jgi:hypothetical protein
MIRAYPDVDLDPVPHDAVDAVTRHRLRSRKYSLNEPLAPNSSPHPCPLHSHQHAADSFQMLLPKNQFLIY